MIKESTQASIKRIAIDRPFLATIALVLMTGIVYLFVVALSLQTRDVQVYVHYTAFGEAHFYKDHWQYFLGFIPFGIIVTLVHLVLMIKLHSLGRRQTAFFVGASAIVILVIALFYILSIMRLAYQ